MPWAVDGGQQNAPMGGQMTPGRKRSLFRFSEIGIERPIRPGKLLMLPLTHLRIFKLIAIIFLEFQNVPLSVSEF